MQTDPGYFVTLHKYSVYSLWLHSKYQYHPLKMYCYYVLLVYVVTLCNCFMTPFSMRIQLTDYKAHVGSLYSNRSEALYERTKYISTEFDKYNQRAVCNSQYAYI